MKSEKQLSVKYSFLECEQEERQKRLDDAFDVVFDEFNLSVCDLNKENTKNGLSPRSFSKGEIENKNKYEI